MASLNQWFEEIIVEVPGATQAGVMQVLRRVFRKFCQDSGAYIIEQEAPIDIQDGVAEYDVLLAYPSLITSDDHVPIYVWAVGYFDDYSADQNRMRFLAPLQTPQYRMTSRAPAQQPWGYSTDIRNNGVIKLVPVVNRDIPEALGTFVAFRLKDFPDFPDDTLPDVFASHWFDIIFDGAIGELCAQQDKSYTNPMKAQLHQRRFRNGISRARDESRNQFNTSGGQFFYPLEGGWVNNSPQH